MWVDFRRIINEIICNQLTLLALQKASGRTAGAFVHVIGCRIWC